jgi:hypothetical protein
VSENLLHNLGEAGRAWTQECLASGRELSRGVLAAVNLAHGTTYLAGLSSESIPALAGHSLDQGIGNPSIISLDRSGESLFEFLKSPELKGSPDIVVEDDLRIPGDPALRQKRIGSTHYFNQLPLHVGSLDSITSSASLVRFLESSASGYPLNSFILPQGQMEDIQTRLTAGNARDLGRSLMAIVNAALDGEAYAVWLPGALKPPGVQSARDDVR